MSFIDAIKTSVLEEFSGGLSLGSLLLSLAIAFVIALYIIFIYKKTYTGVVYSKSFSLSIILLAMVTALVIKTINSNLALSLGMVGALSIVRFRTAVKDPIDTVFMFWAIAGGIMSGAGLYLPSIAASLALGLLFFMAYLFGFKKANRYLLIIKYDPRIHNKIAKLVEYFPKNKLRSKSVTDVSIEVTYEVDLDKDKTAEIVNKIAKIKGVYNSSVINYQNDFAD